jgi:hypothetical protein
MAGGIYAELLGTSAFLTNLATFAGKGELIEDELCKHYAEKLRDNMVRIVQENESVYTNYLIRALEENGVRRAGGPGDYEVGPTGVAYAPYLEYGTRPHTPPMEAITPWAEAHGMTGGQLWAHIKSEGTAAHPFMHPAIEATKGLELSEALGLFMMMW